MLIQKVAKGVTMPQTAQDEIDELERKNPNLPPDQKRAAQLNIIKPYVQRIFEGGILCNWWLSLRPNPLPNEEIPHRLSDRNLYWHQNRYNMTDPLTKKPFSYETPFISASAGTVERRAFLFKNQIHRARNIALRFATKRWKRSGIVFYCYVFVIGKKSVGHMGFAEELRELNIYTGYSRWQPEGEITAKIIIPPAQIEYAEIWLCEDIRNVIKNRARLEPAETMSNKALYLKPEDYHNIRELL
jgi:hypothetical protein